jgi:hypothetical protein
MSEFVGNKEVFKCSKCKCKNFLEGFGKSRLEERYKTCIKCREQRKKNIKRCPCGTIPCFGFLKDKKKICCASCKKDGMINLVHMNNLCPCGIRPCFGFLKDKKIICCKNCKKDGMIDLVHMNNLCPCGTRPAFGFLKDKKKICCKNCKKDGMIDLVNINRLCPCGKQTCFGFLKDKKIICCKNCKKDGMIDLANIKCKLGCDTRASTKRYRGYCSRCFFYTFPDEPITRNYKTKENIVVKYLNENFKEKYDSIEDRVIKGGCSLKRPDKLYDFGSHVVVIEVDENRHSGYNCENKRTMTIFQDIGNRPCVFIRFNPDSYITEEGKKIKSPFSIKKETGLLQVSNKKELNKRLTHLKNTFEKYSHTYTPNKELEIIHLFY